MKKIVLLAFLLCVIFTGCESTPDATDTLTLLPSDILGTWELQNEFTYKEDGVIYGKAKDVFIVTKGSMEDSVFLEVQLTLTEATQDAPEDFQVGDSKTLYLNETLVTVNGNEISLDGTSPYINPGKLNFTFEESDKKSFSWDGLQYIKVK